MKNLFNKKISPYCKYCERGIKSKDNIILCTKYGITKSDYHCKKFKYDPLKRIPTNISLQSNFEKKDFIL